jgi:hypothetical protein
MESEMSKYIQDYATELLRFDDPFAYLTFTDFSEGRGLMQIHSDWGSYSYYWGAMGTDIKSFVAGCDAGYIHTKLKSCVNYQDMKKDAHRKLDSFMIQCWPAIHEEIKKRIKK